jgi:hypothetical protein
MPTRRQILAAALSLPAAAAAGYAYSSNPSTVSTTSGTEFTMEHEGWILKRCYKTYIAATHRLWKT